MSEPLEHARPSKAQRNALALLVAHEERVGRPLEAGDAGTYSGTWADSYTTGVHWRTAEGLRRRGLITIDADGCFDDEPADIYLTDAGRAYPKRHLAPSGNADSDA